MMQYILTLFLLLSVSGVAVSGQVLHDRACLQCHAVLMDGKANAIYTRPNRIVMNLMRLESQVEGCALAADVTWLPKEHQRVVDYLARAFYKFN